MAQAVACNDHCSIPRRLNLSRPALPSSKCWKSPRRIGFRVRAADEAEECNEEACAPEKEVGKVSMEWAVEERTKVLGTFPPTTKQRWTGYVEKDTAGQTNIYSVEPTMYVADSAISSGEAGTSTTGADNKVAISFGLALIFLAGSSSVLLQVGKDPPNAESLEYSGAHSIVVSHCSPFSANRLYNFSGTGHQDPSMDPRLALALKDKCPKPNSNSNFEPTVPLDLTPTRLDEKYYLDLQVKRGVLTSDQALM